MNVHSKILATLLACACCEAVNASNDYASTEEEKKDLRPFVHTINLADPSPTSTPTSSLGRRESEHNVTNWEMTAGTPAENSGGGVLEQFYAYIPSLYTRSKVEVSSETQPQEEGSATQPLDKEWVEIDPNPKTVPLEQHQKLLKRFQLLEQALTEKNEREENARKPQILDVTALLGEQESKLVEIYQAREKKLKEDYDASNEEFYRQIRLNEELVRNAQEAEQAALEEKLKMKEELELLQQSHLVVSEQLEVKTQEVIRAQRQTSEGESQLRQIQLQLAQAQAEKGRAIEEKNLTASLKLRVDNELLQLRQQLGQQHMLARCEATQAANVKIQLQQAKNRIIDLEAQIPTDYLFSAKPSGTSRYLKEVGKIRLVPEAVDMLMKVFPSGITLVKIE
jgi:hypothetical protein